MAQQTALAAAIATTNAVSITVDDFLGFPATGEFTVYIDLEALRVTAGNGTTTWTVTRGYLGTTAATHLDNSTVTYLPDSIVSLATIKTWTSIADVVDDAWLTIAVDACNRAIFRGIGVDLGPSPDATRTYDVRDATRDLTRLRIPGGIRAFTTVEVSNDGTTWVAITSDVRIGPAAHLREPGEPGSFIEFKPYTATYSSFMTFVYVRITGTAFATFGWDEYPSDLVQSAVAALQRAATDRDGRGSFPTETDMARYLNPATIAYYRNLYRPAV